MDRYDGFHDFVVARGGALSRTAYLLTGEHHAAEDLVQTALAKAAARWRQIVDQGQPEAYVRRIMVNERITWWRRRPAKPVGYVPDLPGPDEPHQIVDRIALGQALDTLSPRQRTVVVLRFYEDLSEAETAAAMGCSIGTVKSQTHVALGHLRRALPLFAEQAGQYADANAAVATAARRRARRTAVVAALALVPLALGLIVYAALGPAKVPPPLTPTPTSSPRPSLVAPPGSPALPERVPAAGEVLPDLPKDRGVGPASLLRADLDGGVMTVQIAAASGWYRLRIAAPEPHVPTLWLSPDGRWLSWTEQNGQVMLRDLTGTSQRRLAGSPSFWSRSGNWLVIDVPYPADAFGTRLVPLAGGKEYPLARSGRWDDVKGVLDTGEVLSGTADKPGRTSFSLSVTDPRTGRSRHVDVDVSALLKPDDHVLAHADLPVVVPVTDSTAAVLVFTAEDREHRATYVEFSLVDGTAMHRIDLAGHRGSAGISAFPCLQGRDLIWSDGKVLRRAVFGTTTGGAALDLPADGFAYRLPGCRREAAYREG
ncbi:SigE family RNA polymerase sigma factor [Catellatospora sp. NPDC049111]|uniref:SigE family RNA polymerase sigma factor n=1 Tax=Catellatospora sp. NPDC049111 TaxID=3155271 RepID=UPI0033FB3579